jgi:hypothetical protein
LPDDQLKKYTHIQKHPYMRKEMGHIQNFVHNIKKRPACEILGINVSAGLGKMAFAMNSMETAHLTREPGCPGGSTDLRQLALLSDSHQAQAETRERRNI